MKTNNQSLMSAVICGSFEICELLVILKQTSNKQTNQQTNKQTNKQTLSFLMRFDRNKQT